jgi:nucleotide-binding universal stress UspA family protein
MLPIRTILHPTDFSDRARNAFRLACSLARDYGAHLFVLHVVPTPLAVYVEGMVAEPMPDYQEEVQAQLAALKPESDEVKPEYRSVEGDVIHEILAFAEEHDCDLIVLGTHGRTGLGRLLMGSIAEGVVRRAACPVLTVKTPFPVKHPVAVAENVVEEALPAPATGQ